MYEEKIQILFTEFEKMYIPLDGSSSRLQGLEKNERQLEKYGEIQTVKSYKNI